jgi:hypothetical protein
MNNKFLKMAFAGLVLGVSGFANAGLIVVDDFNDGVISSWTAQSGTFSETGGLFGGSDISLTTLDGATSSSIGVDITGVNGAGYVALVLNYSSLADNLFVKLQDNNGNGLFDTVYFYHGNNGSNAITGFTSFGLGFEVASTFFKVTDNGDGTVSAYVDATGEVFGGSLINTYAGSGVGLGFWQDAQADNFYIETTSVPEPSTLVIFALGLMGLASRRFMKKS